jgi:RNA polymerase sigma-70 factor (sigma-E family)
VKSNDVEAFDAFVRARYAELLRYGRALTGSVEEGADLVQDALERTLRAWPRVRSREDPEGYVRRTMVNRHINTIRRRHREPAMDPLGWTTPEDDRAVWEAIRLLPPRQQAVIAMRYFEDLSVAQTAERLGVSEGTVKSQTAKAKEHLRVLLGLNQEVADG